MATTTTRYPNFQWTFSTLGCPELDLDAICGLAREFGLSFIELRATENTVDLPKLFQERFGNPDSLVRYFDDQQVSISCLDTSLKMIGNASADREAFLEYIPWADAAGIKQLRVFDGGSVCDELDDESFKQANDTIEWWKQERISHNWNVDMAIETHDALVSSKSAARILKVHPDLKIIWDTHHTWKKSSDSLETSWQTLGPNICSTHIKDSISVPSARHPFTYVNLGEGEFPLDEALNLLQDNNYKGFVSIEWERMWHPYLSELKNALQQAKNLNWF